MAPLWVPTRSVWGLQLLHIPTNSVTACSQPLSLTLTVAFPTSGQSDKDEVSFLWHQQEIQTTQASCPYVGTLILVPFLHHKKTQMHSPFSTLWTSFRTCLGRPALLSTENLMIEVIKCSHSLGVCVVSWIWTSKPNSRYGLMLPIQDMDSTLLFRTSIYLLTFCVVIVSITEVGCWSRQLLLLNCLFLSLILSLFVSYVMELCCSVHMCLYLLNLNKLILYHYKIFISFLVTTI